jgi:hypothetical protein
MQRLLLFLPLTYLFLRKYIKDKVSYSNMLVMLTTCTIFHIIFMNFSYYARYEGYLIGVSVIVCSTLFIKYRKIGAIGRVSASNIIAWLFSVLLLAPLITRSWAVFEQVPIGAIWTYHQQFQMGRFVHDHYLNAGIELNDIGVVSYFSEGKKLDIMGLGNNNIARRRHNDTETIPFLDSISRQKEIKIAIVYEPRFRELAKNWKKVASWDIPFKNPVELFESVTFYAVDHMQAPELLANLKAYQVSLPNGINVRYYYSE